MWQNAQLFVINHPNLVWAVGSFVGMTLMSMMFFIMGRRVGQNEFAPQIESLFQVPIDKRKSSRRNGRLVEIVYALEDQPHQRRRGTIRDRSAGGLRITVPDEIKIGTRIAVVPSGGVRIFPGQMGEMALWAEMEVRHCLREDGGWEVGCKFFGVPPYSTLKLFG